jgi:CheY-like chemotaxis protein
MCLANVQAGTDRAQVVFVMIRLLLVDDETDFANNIVGFLNSFPGEFEVTSAFDGENAEKLIDHYSYDVLLTDLRLPDLDGLEIVRHSTMAQPKLRALVMTAYGSSEHRRRALANGALQFVLKPIDLDELRSLLHATYVVGKSYSDKKEGVDLVSVAQHMAALGVTSGLEICSGDLQGQLDFSFGVLKGASTGDLSGPPAFYSMAAWQKAEVVRILRPQECARTPNIDLPTKQLVMAAAGRRNGNTASSYGLKDQSDPGSAPWQAKHPSRNEVNRSDSGAHQDRSTKVG